MPQAILLNTRLPACHADFTPITAWHVMSMTNLRNKRSPRCKVRGEEQTDPSTPEPHLRRSAGKSGACGGASHLLPMRRRCCWRRRPPLHCQMLWQRYPTGRLQPIQRHSRCRPGFRKAATNAGWPRPVVAPEPRAAAWHGAAIAALPRRCIHRFCCRRRRRCRHPPFLTQQGAQPSPFRKEAVAGGCLQRHRFRCCCPVHRPAQLPALQLHCWYAAGPMVPRLQVAVPPAPTVNRDP